MPDKRAHRGRHPEDEKCFGPQAHALLREAVGDLSWLLSRGYADKSSLKIVGDRYNLLERQRIAVMRSACSDASLAGRRERELPASALPGPVLLIDGYNVLTTIEAALAGGVIIIGRDGAYRDMASMHGTFRQVEETAPAIELLGSLLAELKVHRAVWYLDRPVSNSGRLKTRLLEIARLRGWDWSVEVVMDPDAVLSAACDAAVATADSVVLDRCECWVGLAREAVDRGVPEAWKLDLHPPAR